MNTRAPQAEVVEVISLICSYLKDKGLAKSSQLVLDEAKEKLGISEIATNVRDLGDVLSEYLQIRKERIRSQNLANDEKVSTAFCQNLDETVKGLSEIIQDYMMARDMLERKQQEKSAKPETVENPIDSKQIRRGFPGNKKVTSARTSTPKKSGNSSSSSSMLSQVVEDMSERLKQRNSSQSNMPPPIVINHTTSPGKPYLIDNSHSLSNFSFPSEMPLADLDANISRSRMNYVDELDDWNSGKRSRLPPSEDSLSEMLDMKASGLSNFFLENNLTSSSHLDLENETQPKKPKRRITPNQISPTDTSSKS